MPPEIGTEEPRTVVLADGRGATGREDAPTRRVFTRMAIGTAVTLVTIIVGGYFASVRLAEREILANVRTLNEAVAHTLIEPTADLLRDGDAAALAALDDAVRAHLLPNSPVERVKLWAADGRIVYSDQEELIGRVYSLADDQIDVLRAGSSSTDVSDLSAHENEFERAEGATRLFEVYTGVHTDSGENLLFEAYVRYDVVERRQDEILASFWWISVVGLGLLAVSQLWLATTNLRWLQRERTRMAQRSAEVVDEQRRRVARELHDGVVQDLLGAAFLVNGGAAPLRAAGRDRAAESLHQAETTIRTSIRSLRSLLIDLYPANLGTAGLRAALLDLVSPARSRGTEVHLDLPDALDLPDHLEAALYRAAREAVRNASGRGRADHVWLTVRLAAEQVELVVVDDGSGFDPSRPTPDGHLGLRALADEAEGLEFLYSSGSAPGRGAQLRLVLPR